MAETTWQLIRQWLELFVLAGDTHSPGMPRGLLIEEVGVLGALSGRNSKIW